jgi:hypothetical protein
MSNIQLKKDVLVSLSTTAREVYLAGTKPMIRDIKDKNVVAESVAIAVNRVIADKGLNMEKDDIQYLKINITSDILRDFIGFSVEDVSLAFSMGVRGQLGEYFGINVSTLYQWLVKYRQEVVPKANEEIYYVLPKPVVEEKVDKKSLELNLADEIIKLVGSEDLMLHNDFGNIKYNLLDNYHLINFTIDEKMEFYRNAQQEYKNDLEKKNLDLIMKGKSIQISTINNLLDSVENVNKTTNDILIIYAKKIAFRHFISNVNDKEQLETELKNKINEKYGNE